MQQELRDTACMPLFSHSQLQRELTLAGAASSASSSWMECMEGASERRLLVDTRPALGTGVGLCSLGLCLHSHRDT